MQFEGTFKFLDYKIDKTRAILSFNYELEHDGHRHVFCEKLHFPGSNFFKSEFNANLLKNILDSLHLVFGLSYWKTYCPARIILGNIKLSKEQAKFWNLVYTEGLGEFFYQNKLDYRGLINFPFEDDIVTFATKIKTRKRSLVMNGGGKDSIVAMELMRSAKKDFAIFSVNETGIQKAVAMLVGNEKIVVKRSLDMKLLNLKDQANVFNGHVPVSLQWAFIGLLAAIMYDYRYFIAANESSANYGNVKYLGKWVNHQWSKTFAVEKLFCNYVHEYITPSVEYFSLLRSFSEVRIVELFSRQKKYFKAFSSCNANFKMTDKLKGKKWCGHCPKCVFVFTMLSVYLSKKELLNIFGRNLFNDHNLAVTFQELLGLRKIKPFDCVGTSEEMRFALKMAYLRDEFKADHILAELEKTGLFITIDQKKLSKQLLAFSGENNIPGGFMQIVKNAI